MEHLQHPVGHDESTEDVQATEHHGHEPQRLGQERVRLPRNQYGTHQDNPVDGVGARHQRRVQHGGHPADDLEADDDGQCENVCAEQYLRHLFILLVQPWRVRVTPQLLATAVLVRQAERIISSSKSMCSDPSLTTYLMTPVTLREYIWLACTGRLLARLSGPRMLTPCRTTVSPGTVSAQFPPPSAARSTIAE